MKSKSVKLMGLGLAGILALTSAVAMADGNRGKGFGKGFTGITQKYGGANKLTAEQRLAKLKESLDKQVADGKITQEKADEIYAKAQAGDFKGMKPEKKELTEEEKAKMKEDHLAKLKENLDKQVADGKITQEKADEIYAKAQAGDFKGMKPEKKELTEEEKAKMKAEHLAKLKENLDKQVADGKITQEKADEIYAKAQKGPEFKDVFTDEDKAYIKEKTMEAIKEKLDAKVAAGTITQEQADEILARQEKGKFGPTMGGGRGPAKHGPIGPMGPKGPGNMRQGKGAKGGATDKPAPQARANSTTLQ